MFERFMPSEQACEPSFWGFLSTVFIPLDIASIAALITAGIAAGGLVFAKRTIRVARENAKTQATLNMLYEFKKDEMAREGLIYIDELRNGDTPITMRLLNGLPYDREMVSIISALDEIDHIALAVKNDLIDIRYLGQKYHTQLVTVYDYCYPLVRYLRDSRPSDDIYIGIEWLYKKWIKENAENGSRP